MNNTETAEQRARPFQRENVYNKLLPYADKLDDESSRLFCDIKTHLVKAFLAREVRPGCAIWTARLHKYMKIYGLKFSKDDHICFIKLFYELLIIPNLEPTRIIKFASTLTFLLKKKDLLSRDDLQLDWRPLYELWERISKRSNKNIGMYRYLSTLEHTFNSLIKSARIYFPVEATQEILDEFRPMLCPFSKTDMVCGMSYLQSFLPVCMKPEEAERGYGLWFEELMDFWNMCHNENSIENEISWLMADLAQYNVGRIDWSPHVPTMFVRFMRVLQLPVGYRHRQSGKQFKIETAAMATWIVSALGGPNDIVFSHLEQFMQTIESYFHTANTGRWTPKIRDLLKRISLNFVTRVHNERHRKPSWQPLTPVTHRLTDSDIERFVNMMKPYVEHSVYSRHHQEMTLTFNYLASLRPDIIVPVLLDKLYLSMDSLTEPHKLTSAVVSVTAVSRYMVQGQRVNYPEGPTHVIPLLNGLLPGIDPNDIRKCFITFNFILQFVNMIPLLDSSEASRHYDDLTDEEHIVCEATAGFEDFVLQFLDRLCTWVESNVLESTRMEQNDNDRAKSKSDILTETALVAVLSTVLTQCPPKVFHAALKKMHQFAMSRIFEIKVSGRMMSMICQVFAQINPVETAKLFIPNLCDLIDKLLDDTEDVAKEENLDEELLYCLLLLSEIVDVKSEVVVYQERLQRILDRILFMTSIQGSQLAARMLTVMMTTLTFISPREYRSTATPYDTHVKDFLPVREWGKAGNIRDLRIDWFVPGEPEIRCVQSLLDRYLVPELDRLKAYSCGSLSLGREELRKTFKIIFACLGCHTVLPLWQEPALNIIDSILDPWAFELIVESGHFVSMPDGRNVRKVIADVVHGVQEKLLEVDEGDTKSIFSIIRIYDLLLFNKFRGKDFEHHWKTFHVVKELMEDKVHKNKMHLRHILIDRVMLHQEFRNESRSCTFTQTHKQILLDLFQLSTCRYSEVRISAQTKLFNVITRYRYSYRVLTPSLVAILRSDSTENHESFKGCLYTLLGPKSTPLVARHDWSFIRDVWPLLVRSKPSEKLSIVNLIDALVNCVHKFFPTIAINLEIPEKSLTVGYELAAVRPEVDLEGFSGCVEDGVENLRVLSERNLMAYRETVDSLLDAACNGNLHWRYHLLAICFLRDLVHCDVKYSPAVVKFFLHTLLNDLIKIRKIGLKLAIFILIQNKPDFRSLPIDPKKFNPTSTTNQKATNDPPTTNKRLVEIGLRPENQWLLYDSSNIPDDVTKWNQSAFVHKEYVGFYSWPKQVKVAAPPTEQPKVLEGPMTEQQVEIFKFFTDEKCVEGLVRYFSMEEKKGNDKFNPYRYVLFKYLFKIYEDKILEVFLPHLRILVEDDQEQSQRCVAEIISGLISGCKHWTFEKTKKMWQEILPIIRTAFNHLSNETMMDWAGGISMGLEDRDPRKYHFLLEFLLDNPLAEQSSFVGCCRIYILQCALAQQSWRNSQLITRNLTYLKTHLDHQFQNVRDKIGWCLTVTFAQDFRFPAENFLLPLSTTNPQSSYTSITNCPRVDEFFEEINSVINDLYESTLLRLERAEGVDEVTRDLKLTAIEEDTEREKAIRIFKVVAKYVTGSLVKVGYSAVPEHFRLLPLACVLQSNEVDDELTTICTNLIAMFANIMIAPAYVGCVLDAADVVAHCPFWSARAVIAEFTTAFVFHNMSTIRTSQIWIEKIVTLALKLLEDLQPEVRVKASNVISGLLHCNFIPDPAGLLTSFRKKAKTKLKLKEAGAMSNLHVRHAGVLGLCSYVNAHPYDVPDFLPGIFEELGPHMNDPQPIPTTIRKTLGDFKRTHHSDWENHKLKFTESELIVLSDLTVPPSYYA